MANSKTPNYDAKVKTILENLQPGERTCELTGEKWMMDEEEIGWYKKFNVPPSTVSPVLRLWQNAAFYTCYQWWWNKHFETGEPVLTYVHPGTGLRVLPDKEWFARDFTEVSADVDLALPLFPQLRELQLRIPLNATRNTVEPENAIATVSMGDKDSYFVSSSKSKSCLYNLDCQDAEGCVDCNAGISITDCYRVSYSSRIYRCLFTFQCYDCLDSAFLFDCRNCESCFGASNKRNRKYLWWNEQLSKDEWEKRRKEVDLGTFDGLEALRKEFMEMIEQSVWPENFNVGTTGSIGEYLIECSDCRFSSFGRDGHHNYYCFGIWSGKDNAFSTAIPGEHNYHAWAASSSHCKFSTSLVRCDDCEYSLNCYDCSHCFGCIGLRHKSYHIFNKPYAEEEYWRRVDELKCVMLERGEYGRMLPPMFSFGYFPESGAVFYLGAGLEDWDKVGMSKFSIDAEGAFGALRMEGKTVLRPDEVPNHVDQLDESWAGRAILDTEIKRPFAFLKPEITFYKKHRIAPPRQHFTARIRDLIWASNSGLMEKNTCSNCHKEIYVATNRTFTNRKIYCQSCYVQYLETNS